MSDERERHARSGSARSDNDPFLEKVAEPLRASERADATFEARAMSAIHAAAGARQQLAVSPLRDRIAWWLRPRQVLVTPLRALALAAGIVALAATPWLVDGTRARDGGQEMAEAGRVDTVHVVRFVLLDPGARTVALVGEFNHWEKAATPLSATSAGVWTVSVPLGPGRHEYAFIVTDANGERWVADPLTHATRDEFGTESSVIYIGASAT